MGNVDLHTMLDNFVVAFNDLDWPVFRSMFTQEATVFAPGPPVTTLTTVEGCFQPVFEQAKKSGTGPPYLNIDPQNLQIREFESTALVTFHLRGLVGYAADELNRRTLFLVKTANVWQIDHLHASTTKDLPGSDAQ